IHTAILPEMVTEAREHGLDRVARSLRWALERMALLVVPVSAAMVVLALPAMRLVPFGDPGGDGSELLAAAGAGLAGGLFPYGAFLLLARGYYALGDSRTPGLVSLGAASAGVVVMIAGALTTDGPARIAVLGLGHSLAYGAGALALVPGPRTRPLPGLPARDAGPGRRAPAPDRRVAVARPPRPHRRRGGGGRHGRAAPRPPPGARPPRPPS